MTARKQTFGAWLRSARNKAGLSLRALGEKIDVSAPYLSDVENERRAPIATSRWPVLASALGVTEQEIAAAAERQRCPTCGHILTRREQA